MQLITRKGHVQPLVRVDLDGFGEDRVARPGGLKLDRRLSFSRVRGRRGVRELQGRHGLAEVARTILRARSGQCLDESAESVYGESRLARSRLSGSSFT